MQSWLGLANDVSANRIYVIHTDHLGTPRMATDQKQQVVWQAGYTAFGKASVSAQSITLNLRLPGQYFDSETGTHYNYFRDYDPNTGRYLTSDPIGLRGKIDTYGYVEGNPLGAIDPVGLRTIVVGNTIKIRPEDLSVPPVDIPNTVGAGGFTPNNINFHYYDVTAVTTLTACQVGRGLRDNPTPGNDTPASVNGTRNNAGEIPQHGLNNFVRSFYIVSPNPLRWTDITVNYTISGEHGLHEGYVIRYGQISGNGGVTMRSYGEGEDAVQNMLIRPIWIGPVHRVWQNNYREIE